MKKIYLTPYMRFAQVLFEEQFLASGSGAAGGTATGEDLDTPEDFNPWG